MNKTIQMTPDNYKQIANTVRPENQKDVRVGYLVGNVNGDIVAVLQGVIPAQESSPVYSTVKPGEIQRIQELAKADGREIVGMVCYHPTLVAFESATERESRANLSSLIGNPCLLIVVGKNDACQISY